MKKYMIYLLSAMQIGTTFASSEHQLYQDAPALYYAQHPAITDQQNRGNIETLPVNVICNIGGFLDFTTAQNYVRALWCTTRLGAGHVFAQNIGVLQIPNRYTEASMDYKNVFIPFDHPAWQPAALPSNQLLALHSWFFKARAIIHKLEADDVTLYELSRPDKANAVEAFRMFYSAGCLGHMLAAAQAGKLLLDPRLNDVLPLIPSYDWLMPGVAQYDIKRLNQPQSGNPEVEEIMNDLTAALNELFDFEDGQENLSKADTALRGLTLLRPLRERAVKAAEASDEAKVIEMILDYAIDRYEHGNIAPIEEMPEHIRAYAKSISITSHLIASILMPEDEYSQEARHTARKNVAMCLNCDLLGDLACTLDPLVGNLTVNADGSITHMPLLTNEAQVVRLEKQNLEFLSVLLGSKDTAICTLYPSINSLDYQAGVSEFLERARIVFMYHLNFTRGFTPFEYRFVQNLIRHALYRPGGKLGNLVRLQLLNKHFGFDEDPQ